MYIYYMYVYMWLKTMVQALGSSNVEPLSISVLGNEIRVVEDFVYLTHSLVQSSPDILWRSALKCTAMESMDSTFGSHTTRLSQAEIV